MKKQIFWTLAGALLMTGLLLVGGFSRGNASPSIDNTDPAFQAVPVVAPPNDFNTTGETQPAGTGAPPTEVAPVAPGAADKPAPPNVTLTPPASEVVKLAQAGVGDSVMLAYVTNS